MFKQNSTAVVIPEGTVVVTGNMFKDKSKSAHLLMPSSVVAVDDYALAEHDNLNAIQLSSRLKVIGAYAFYKCSGLPSITLPDSVVYVDPTAFLLCENLSRIDVNPDNPVYKSVDGILYTKNDRSLMRYPEWHFGDQFVVPDEVIEIGEKAFCGCTRLHEIVIPTSVISIAEGAFYGCINLKSIFYCNNRFDPSSLADMTALMNTMKAIQSDWLLAFCNYRCAEASELWSDKVPDISIPGQVDAHTDLFT